MEALLRKVDADFLAMIKEVSPSQIYHLGRTHCSDCSLTLLL